MAEWVWEARTKAGEIKKGIIEAEDDKAVFNKLRLQNMVPMRVRKKGVIDLSFITELAYKVADKDLVIFTRQFATIIDAGHLPSLILSSIYYSLISSHITV